MPKPIFDDAGEASDGKKPFDTAQGKKEPEEEIKELMENHDLEQDEAEEVKELMDETGLDEDEAVELKDAL